MKTKQITNHELAVITVKLLVKGQEGNDPKPFSHFMTEVAQAVCKYKGGWVGLPADNEFEDWLIGIRGLADDDRTFEGFDEEGEENFDG